MFFLRDAIAAIEAEKPDSDSVFCDVGANIGQHSLFMSRLTTEVHSFEPYATVAKRLHQHIALNEITNISVHPVGLSDKTEALNFFAPTGRNQAIGSFDEDSVGRGNADMGKLPLVRGDEYFQQQGIRELSIIKIDVEGFEKHVIAGLQQTLARDRPWVVCEISYGISQSFASRAELLELFPQDYSLLTFDTRKSDGGKARRRGARARLSGHYELIEFSQWRNSGQDDIVACPTEQLEMVPRENVIGE